MNPLLLLFIFIGYFLLLFLISYWVGRTSNAQSFFTGNKKSPWFVVAFGMVGATLSGVSFISVPGEVGNSAFHYFQFVLGNFAGYIIIATLLLPYYYRKNIISIYSVLSHKMGKEGYLTTSGFFIVSKIIGAAFRLYLAALVIHMSISRPMGISFELTVLFCLALIWLYTHKSGIKTVVWSDMLQTAVLLTAVAATIIAIIIQLDVPLREFSDSVMKMPEVRIFDFDVTSPHNFFKQFISGIFITIALNGFDQDIVQKNLTCHNAEKARKNMLVFSVMFIVAIFLFLILGATLYQFSHLNHIEIPERTDYLLPEIALNYLGYGVAVLFILGISAAAFSSADSATTALTTAFCIDFLNIETIDKKKQKALRNRVHLAFNLLIFIIIVIFYKLNNESVVNSIFKAAGYTYGPILAVFFFSFFSKRKPRNKYILPICLASPVLTYLLTVLIKTIAMEYSAGFELIVFNALIAYFLLLTSSKKH